MNVQRETIYSQRRKILEGIDLKPTIMDYLHQTVRNAVDENCPADVPAEEWDCERLFDQMNDIFPLEVYARVSDLKKKSRDELIEFLDAVVERTYQDKEQEIGIEAMREAERQIALHLINSHWMDHLEAMDYLREGIGLRGYAQQDPLVAYKKEAFEMFMDMQHAIQNDIVHWVYRIQPPKPEPQRRVAYRNVVEGTADLAQGDGMGSAKSTATTTAPRRPGGKIGRNDPCPCGSGKKYKKCCLPKEESQV